MVKVCLFCRHFYPHIGGNETQTMNLALGLVKQGVDVIVVTARIDKTYKKVEKYEGFDIYRADYFSLNRIFRKSVTLLKGVFSVSGQEPTSSQTTNSGNPLRGSSWKCNCKEKLESLNYLIEEYSFMWSATSLLRRHRHKFDIIHSQMLLNYGYMALRAGLKLHKKVLIKDASLGGLEKVSLRPNVSGKRDLLRKKGNFVAISSMIAENFRQQGIDDDRVFLVMNGIDSKDIDHKNNWDARPDTILFAGNYWQGEIKGLDILIKALGEVVKDHSEVQLRIAGQGNQDMYRLLARKYGCERHIDFLGQVTGMDKEYRGNAIFVLPSRQEGMSNSVLEAMSYGMSCVVADVSGGRDQIESGKEGLIVPVGDYHEMAKAIVFMLDNRERAKEMGLAAKKKIIEKFDMRINTSRIVDVYKKLLS